MFYIKFIFFVLFQYIWVQASPCLADSQMCGKRSTFIYELDKILNEVSTVCKQRPRLQMNWKSFEQSISGNDRYRPDDCLLPIKFFLEFCEVDPSGAKKILSNIDLVKCQGIAKGNQALVYKNKVLEFSNNPAHDYNKGDNEKSTAEFVNAEMKKVLGVSVISHDDLKQKNKERENEKSKVEEVKRETEQKRQADEIKKQVEATNAKAKVRADKYQADTNRLTEWLQNEIKKVQASTLAPQQKSEKMQGISEKYRLEMEKAAKEYSEDK